MEADTFVSALLGQVYKSLSASPNDVLGSK